MAALHTLVLALVLASAGGIFGCRGVRAPAATPELAEAEGARFEVFTLEDLSRARDVFRTATHVYVSTDRGLLVYPTAGPPRAQRLGLAAGLATQDVLVTRMLDDGTLVVLSAGGLEALSARGSAEAAPPLPLPAVGTLRDIEVFEGALHACGSRGLARLTSGRWQRLTDQPGGGELACRSLTLGAIDSLLVVADAGLLRLRGDVLSEHRAPAFPTGDVRFVAENQAGELWAWVEQAQGGVLAWHQEGRWWTYAWPHTGSPVVGLAYQAGVALVVTEAGAWRVTSEARGGAPLHGLEAFEGGPLMYRVEAQEAPALPVSASAEHGVARPAPAAQRVERDLRGPSSPRPPPGSALLEGAPRLYAHALPRITTHLEAVFVSGPFVYLAERGRGVTEVGEARRRLVAPDFSGGAPLHAASDARGGTWVRADDGSLARIAGDGVARLYPHGRASALLENVAGDGTPWASDIWVALSDPSGDVILASPTPSGWLEQTRLAAEGGTLSPRLGARTESGHLWLVLAGERGEWSEGYGLAHKAPGGEWFFFSVPLEPVGAEEAIRVLVPFEGGVYAGGPSGLVRVDLGAPPSQASTVPLHGSPVLDVERRGERVLVVSQDALFETSLAARGSRLAPIRFEEEAAEGLRRVRPTGIALRGDTLAVGGPGGIALRRGAETLSAWSELLRVSASQVHGSSPHEQARDVDYNAQGQLLARRDGALLLMLSRPR